MNHLRQLAFVLLAAGALGGAFMAARAAFGRGLPAWLGTLHGLAGLAGLVVLFAANLGAAPTGERAWWALGVLAAAFLGGLVVLRTLFPGRPPAAVLAVHGGLALAGLYLLWPVAFAA